MKRINFIFLFAMALLSLLSVGGSAQAEEPLLPLDRVLQQEAVWKGHRLELFTTPSRPLPFGPLDVYIRALKEGMETPFSGTIRVGFEKLSQKNASLQETLVTPEDYEGPGLARITHIFQEPGAYGVTVTLTDERGDLYVLQGKVDVISQGLSLKMKISLFVLAGVLICFGVFYKIRVHRKHH